MVAQRPSSRALHCKLVAAHLLYRQGTGQGGCSELHQGSWPPDGAHNRRTGPVSLPGSKRRIKGIQDRKGGDTSGCRRPGLGDGEGVAARCLFVFACVSRSLWRRGGQSSPCSRLLIAPPLPPNLFTNERGASHPRPYGLHRMRPLPALSARTTRAGPYAMPRKRPSPALLKIDAGPCVSTRLRPSSAQKACTTSRGAGECVPPRVRPSPAALIAWTTRAGPCVLLRTRPSTGGAGAV